MTTLLITIQTRNYRKYNKNICYRNTNDNIYYDNSTNNIQSLTTVRCYNTDFNDRSRDEIVQIPVNLIDNIQPIDYSRYMDLLVIFGKVARIQDFTTQSTFTNFCILQHILYSYSGATYGDYSLTNIKRHIDALRHLTIFDLKGFVSQSDFDTSYFFNLFRTLFPKNEPLYRAVSGTEECPRDPSVLNNVIFYATHLKNILYLYLIFEIKLSIKKNRAEGTTDAELECELELASKLFSNQITAGVRKEITRRHFSFQSKVYGGFDSEYETEEVRKVTLVCYTLATYERCYLRYAPLRIDYTTDASGKGRNEIPLYYSSLIEFILLFIRRLDNRPDVIETHLIERLNSKVSKGILDRLELRNGIFLFTQPRSISSLFSTFNTHYSEDISSYSFETLVTESLKLSKDKLSNNFAGLSSIIGQILGFSSAVGDTSFLDTSTSFDSVTDTETVTNDETGTETAPVLKERKRRKRRSQKEEEELEKTHRRSRPVLLKVVLPIEKKSVIPNPLVNEVKSITRGMRYAVDTEWGPVQLNITGGFDLYLISHYSAADISTLSDF